MTEISNKQIDEISRYWLFYTKESGEQGSIQLSACANNFRIHRGCEPDGELQCVGLRSEKDGCGYYELFNVGHTKIRFPLKPNPLKKLLKGSKAELLLRQEYEAFEKQLNEYGWKTIAESN